MNPIITILAGGTSRRMGRDKGVLEVDGEPLLLRTARTALACGQQVAVVGRERPVWWPEDCAVTFIPDEVAGEGPAGGVASGLRWFSRPLLLLACDLPLIDREAIGWLVHHLPESAGADGTILMRGSQPEPLLSLYHPSLLPRLQRRLTAGRRSLIGLLDDGEFGRVDVPERLIGRLRGANTPEELAALIQERGEE